MTKKQMIIWFAGFFEGEGSIGLNTTSAGNKTVYLVVYQKKLKILRSIKSTFGGTLSNPRYKASKWQRARRVGRIQWTGNKARDLAKSIRPYIIGEKAGSIDKALASRKPKYYDV